MPEQDIGHERALGKGLHEALAGFVRFSKIAGQVQSGDLALQDFFFSLRQDLLIEDLVVGVDGILVESGRLLGVAQFKENLSPTQFRVRVGVGQLSLLSGSTKSVYASLVSLLLS